MGSYKMFKIPSFIDTFLNDNSFEFVDLVQKSNWKKTYILKIRKNSKYFILKAYSKDTPKSIKQKFMSEIRFYQNNSKEYLPKLILNTENILIIEYINGVTLREILIKNEITEATIQNLFTNIYKLYDDSKEIINNTYFF
jgi:predicted Ser/Thr protein kinase